MNKQIQTTLCGNLSMKTTQSNQATMVLAMEKDKKIKVKPLQLPKEPKVSTMDKPDVLKLDQAKLFKIIKAELSKIGTLKAELS